MIVQTGELSRRRSDLERPQRRTLLKDKAEAMVPLIRRFLDRKPSESSNIFLRKRSGAKYPEEVRLRLPREDAVGFETADLDVAASRRAGSATKLYVLDYAAKSLSPSVASSSLHEEASVRSGRERLFENFGPKHAPFG